MRKINQARNYKESSENMGSKIPDVPQHQMRKEDRLALAEARLLNDDGGAGASSIVEITQPGYYNLNHYLFCKDVKDAQQLFNNANIYGLVAGRKLNRMEMIMSGKTHEWFGWDLDYKGDKILADGFQIRRNINAIKANIAENFGTFGDLVIENLDSGKLARLTGENIFHKKEFTPKKDILRPTCSSIGYPSVKLDVQRITRKQGRDIYSGGSRRTYVRSSSAKLLFPSYKTTSTKAHFSS